MTVQLTKSVGIYERDVPTDPDVAALIEEDCRILFTQIDEDTGVRTRLIWIEEPMWADMGSPGVVTVTIEPGDKLN